MIKCAIIDDEPLSRDVLRQFIEDHPDLELSGEYKDALDAMPGLVRYAVDLIFLDINMPNLSGINFYKSLAEKPLVIFTTAYPEFALDGYELNAVDYLMKPIAFGRFFQAVQKVKDRINISSKVNGYMMLKVDKKLYRTSFSDILFFEALGDYVKVHLSDQVLIITHTMKKLLTELPTDQFIRTHKSFIINKSKVQYVEGNRLKVGTQMVAIGQVYREQVLAAFH